MQLHLHAIEALHSQKILPSAVGQYQRHIMFIVYSLPGLVVRSKKGVFNQLQSLEMRT